MKQKILKNLCMSVLLMLAAISLSPSWAGGDNYEAKIKVIGDGFALDTTDVSGLEDGESMTFYADDGKEILVTRISDGFDISIDGEPLDMPELSGIHGGHRSVKVITKEFSCDGDEECDHEFVDFHADGGAHVEVIRGGDHEVAMDVRVIKSYSCDSEEDCDHDVQVWHGEEGELIEILNEHEDGKKVIIIKERVHSEHGEEI